MVLSFEDLISLRVVAALRAHRVPWKAIWAAERWLRQSTRYERPLAREELWTTRSDIFVSFRDRIMAASRNGQLAMDVVQEYLIPISGLMFTDHVATQWRLARGILIDPLVQFGEPCLEGTRIPVRAVLGLLAAGDPPDLVQRSYNLTDSAMDAARAWRKLAAAA